jgi:hypothetical protein
VQRVEGQRADRDERERQRAPVAGRDVLGHPLPHRRLQADAAAHAADVDEEAGLGLVEVRQEIAGERDPAAPAMLDRLAFELREHLADDALEMGPVGGALRLAERAASAHDEAAGVVEAEVEQQLAGVGGDLALGQDRFADVVGERMGRDLERVRSDNRLAQPRHEVAGVAVGADDDLLRRHRRPALRRHREARAVA